MGFCHIQNSDCVVIIVSNSFLCPVSFVFHVTVCMREEEETESEMCV